jgi:hypothetical protein
MPSDSTAKAMLRWLNVGLRGIMEAGIVVAFAIWGYHAASGVMAIALAIVVPALGFGFWGAVDFHQAGTFGEPLRLAQELIISMLAAFALYLVGQPIWAWALAIVSVVHHAAVYALGGRLLKKETR